MSNELSIIESQLRPLAPYFEEALAGVMPVERLIRTIVVSIEKTPKLMECSKQSVLNAAMTAAVLGLEVDGSTGQAFLIPFANQCQLVIGYKGFNTLGARAGMTITGEVVREGDDFDYDLGEGWVKHKPSLASISDRRIIGAWAKAAATGRPPIVCVMGIDELMAVKDKSPGAKKKDSPWNDPKIGFPAMCSKTVKRRLQRSMPLSVYSLGAALDEAVEERGKPAYIRQDHTLMVEGQAIQPGEAAEAPDAEDLMWKESPGEIIDRLEKVATEEGLDALGRAWSVLDRRIQQTLGVEERDRLKSLAI